MHGIGMALLIALTNSVDSLGAWIALSLKGIKVTNRINLWISFVIFAVSCLCAWIGTLLLGVIDSRVCAWISMAVFVAMGVWCAAEPLLRRVKRARDGHGIIDILENPEEADQNRSKDIDFKEATLLAVALSINNTGGSFSAGMIGLNPWLIGVLSAAMSYTALWVGRWISAFLLKKRLGDTAAVLSGVILILIGIKQIL